VILVDDQANFHAPDEGTSLQTFHRFDRYLANALDTALVLFVIGPVVQV